MIAFDNSYARLPPRFSARVSPSAAVTPKLIAFNHALAAQLGLETSHADEADLERWFSGHTLPPGADPLAMAYAGHQFGHFVPQLGDGRAILLGEVVGGDGLRYDIQLKGAGQTPFSRRGDGRAALGPVLREYIVSEAMAALGVPTTRSLAAVATGDTVYREAELPGAVLTRVARGHVRVGTFQYFAARGDAEALKALTAYTIGRHYPAAANADTPALALLDCVVSAQAALIAKWMSVGFVHGVMNTDNMAISGETIDYGPCAFLDTYHPNTVFSSIDEHGRYAFANQPRIAQWNLARLAETLLPLIDSEEQTSIARATAALNAFGPAFELAFTRAFRAKLGLARELPEDLPLIQALLNAMAQGAADFTLTFRSLAESTGRTAASRQYFAEPQPFDEWVETWRARLALEDTTVVARQAQILAANPAFIPRNHRIEQVIQAAVQHADFVPFRELAAVLSRPFDPQPEHSAYSLPPEPHERVERTFCGT